MAERLPALFSKLAFVAIVGVLGTAGLTYAAEEQIAAPATHRPATAKPRAAVLVVPDVHNQAFVFAKGVLQDSGFAWQVRGAVQGFAPNVVVEQWPAPGTRVLDTGAPLVMVKLARNGSYPQNGIPENISPYRPTAVRAAQSAVSSLLTPYAQGLHLVKPKAVSKARPTANPKPAAAAATRETTKAKAHPRSPAFVVAGAPKEPLDEMPLPDRAYRLGGWLAHHPQPSNPAVKHWLYQNSWIVAGARFGWWHGAEALRTLIKVDARTESLWGIGAKSRQLAENALAEVEARTR